MFTADQLRQQQGGAPACLSRLTPFTISNTPPRPALAAPLSPHQIRTSRASTPTLASSSGHAAPAYPARENPN